MIVKWSNRNVKLKFLKDWFSDWRAYLAEFLGTFVVVLIICGTVLVNNINQDVGILGIALVSGFIYGAMMFATVHLSGGHLNPAITLALWLSQKIKGATAFFYVVCQLLASFAAAGFLLLIFGQNAKEFLLGGPVVGVGVSLQNALIIEAVLTAILVFAYFATLVDRRGPVSFGPLVVGFVYLVSGIFATSLSGAVLNPARALGPAVISRSFDTLVIWIVGPAAGGLFGIVYDFLFLKKTSKNR